MAHQEPTLSDTNAPPNSNSRSDFVRTQRTRLLELGVPNKKIDILFKKASVSYAVNATELAKHLMETLPLDEIHSLLADLKNSSAPLEERLDVLARHGATCGATSTSHLNSLVWGALWLVQSGAIPHGADAGFVQKQRQHLLKLGVSSSIIDALFVTATAAHAVEAFEMSRTLRACSTYRNLARTIQDESKDQSNKVARLAGLGIKCDVGRVDQLLAGALILFDARNSELESKRAFAKSQHDLLTQRGFSAEQIKRLFNIAGVTHAVEAAELAQAAELKRGRQAALELLKSIASSTGDSDARQIWQLKQSSIPYHENAIRRIKRLLAGAISLLDIPS